MKRPSLGTARFDEPASRRRSRPALHPGDRGFGHLWHARLFGDFTCLHCRREVLTDSTISGVLHRNHCPYCLWSRHVDLFESGDRLAVCKGPMAPIGLAFKNPRKRYAALQPGEMQLIHRCADCGALSLNRLAADDLPPAVWDVYQSAAAAPGLPNGLPGGLPDVIVAGPHHHALVHLRLFGHTQS